MNSKICANIINILTNLIAQFDSIADLSQDIRITERLFITSDLKRHFYCNDKIEVDAKSSENSKYVIQANFWNSEFETFRLSPEDRFILPKDSESVPKEGGPICPSKPEKL